MPGTKIIRGMPGGTNTISNSSTFSGWLESTGLDEMMLNPCSCIWGEEPPPPPLPGERRRNNQQQQANGKGTRNVVVTEEPESGIFGLASLFGGKTRTQTTVQTVKSEPSSSAFSFWQHKSMTLLDLYSDQGDPSEKCGDINFAIDYDFNTQTLKLKIIQGKDLAARDANGLSDPYVRITLLPDKKHRLETKIKRRTLNPKWNETFYFEGFPVNKLQNRVLHLHVYDYDRFSRDDSIGELHLPLCQIDFATKPNFWRALHPQVKEKLGELLVSLTYLPSTNTLSIGLLKARNLKAKDINGKSDPYIKVWLLFGEKRVDKKKTPVYKCNLNPTFNQNFEFDVPWEQIRDCSLEVSVMDFDTIGRNELIGRLMLGARNGSGARETNQWGDMIAKPRQAAIVWHRLKPGES